MNTSSSSASSIPSPVLATDVPRAFVPLLMSTARYKGAYGGRGGAKSHFFAEQMLARCRRALTRAVCIREVQNSIRDSVRQLLVDKITKLGLWGFFEVTDTEIRGANGSLIIFKGMHSYNADTIKSLEAYDIAWVEEAQTLSEHSFQMLYPTIRRPGSEMWFSWNPRHRTDAVDKFFRKNADPNDGDVLSVAVNWRDNPWFPEVLHRDMERDRKNDPDLAEHIWNGAYGMEEGAILARLVDAAEREGRINDDVVYKPNGLPIEISCDIGYRDASAWWFWQRRIGGYALLDYDVDSNLHAPEWIERLQKRLDERNWLLGRIWLPHDARHDAFRSQHNVIEQFLHGFGPGKSAIVPMTTKLQRINAARTVIRKCEFHRTRCELGLDGLRAWKFAWDPELEIFSKEPVHDWAGHPSDGFSYGCQVMQEQKPPEIEAVLPIEGLAHGGVTLDMLWKEKSKGGPHRRL